MEAINRDEIKIGTVGKKIKRVVLTSQAPIFFN